MDRRRFLTRCLEAAGAAAVGPALGPLVAGCRPKRGGEGPAGRGGEGPAGRGGPGGAGRPEPPGSPEAPAVPPPEHRQPRSVAADLVVCAGADAYAQTIKAVAALGGIDLFVRPGDRVVLTPNLAFARTPEQGANTHPRVLRAMIDVCVKAGASRVTVVDHVLDRPELAFRLSGAEEAVRGTSATLLSPSDARQYQKLDVAHLKTHAAHTIAQALAIEVAQAQVLIALPVFKQHAASGLSGALKKLMGVIWERRAYHGADLAACIAEINTVIKPTLIVGDATRVLQSGGPKGPGEITKPNQVLAAVDPVAADAYACRYLRRDGPLKPEDVPHLVKAAALGRGRLDVGALRILEVTA